VWGLINSRQFAVRVLMSYRVDASTAVNINLMAFSSYIDGS